MDLDDTSTIADDDTEKPDSDEEFLLAKEETAYQVHRTLWNDFYDWEQAYCLQTLLGLERPAVCPEALPSESSADPDSFDSWNEFTEWFTFQNSAEGYEDALPLRLDLEETNFRPYSSYSFCTPSSTNAQPSRTFDKAQFTPFSDDPKFKKDKYLSNFNSFAWQTEFWDPDREIIFLETARRLHHGHGFSDSEIDNLRLHYVPLRVHGSAGMIWEVSQRDRLLWPAAQMSMLPDLVQRVPSNLNADETLTQGIVSFCDNLNCIRSSCSPHDTSHPIMPVKPAMTSKDLRSLQVTPCDRDCFKSYVATDAEFDLSNLDGSWDEEDVSSFLSVIKFAPDSRPCDLAVICRKPCIETYIQRCKHFIDDDDIEEKGEASTTEPANMIFVEDNSANEVLKDRVKQCYHPGACNQYSNCACYNNHQRCQRTCRCPKTCNLRFKGCKCSGSKPCAETSNCPCRNVGRECEPDVCVPCDARNSKGSRSVTCRNTVLQRGGFPQIWVHSSQYGLGAYAMTKIDAGRCIGDYVGEILGDEAVSLSMIRRFLHRNYAFTLTKSLYSDSYLLGNETRYLNHSNNSNCYSKLTIVNGDVKIGIYAGQPIKERGELLLDYGPTYWNESDNGESD